MEFRNAKEFADYIKTELYERQEEADDIEIRLAALKESYGDMLPGDGKSFHQRFNAIDTAYSGVIEGLVSEFYETLPISVKNQFASRFHFTTIDNLVLNAHIRRSSDGRFYGIFIYSALITVLHRLGKLELACFYPEMVRSCSRFPGKPATRKKMIEIYAEVYAYFINTKLPHGPLVTLWEPLNRQHLQKLHIQELLIMYHEIAHFLNGDLQSGNEKRKVIRTFTNESYQREHLADVIGFGLLIRHFAHSKPLTRELRYLFLICLIELSKIQHEIQGIETEAYPHPLNRMSVVIDKFYGPEVEEWVSTAILNDRTQDLDIANFPDFTTDEENIFRYIEQQLVNAFND